MWAQTFSMRVYNAKGTLTKRETTEIVNEFKKYGALHVVNTGLSSIEQFKEHIQEMGFNQNEQYTGGGRTSSTWQNKWVTDGVRNMDYYPPDLYLLPNNEIQYQRSFPKRIVFYCHSKADVGGRTFVHSAKRVYDYILAKGQPGIVLLNKLKMHGLSIETGFLDQNNPFKQNNYFQSWQERFDTLSRDEAIRKCLSLTNEYDECWWQTDRLTEIETHTLMTKITIPAFIYHEDDGNHYMRFPRIALDGPMPINGYRRFPLGNGEELHDQEKNILLEAYLATREGCAWNIGDFILLDNIRYAHSRESFEGKRDVVLSMAGLAFIEPRTKTTAKRPPYNQDELNQHIVATPPSNNLKAERYTLPSNSMLWNSKTSMRVYNAKNKLDASKLQEISHIFKEHGALLITHTGINPKHSVDIEQDVLFGLGFDATNQFKWGGLTCGRTNIKYLSKLMRETDKYPKNKILLPHNEILYQRFMPESLLFFYYQPTPAGCGGRTFVHDALDVENYIANCGRDGLHLLEKLHQYGLTIITGFLDKNHPQKAENYFRSWQDRFETEDRHEALAICKKSSYQFDDCYWLEEPTRDPEGKPFYTLMTKITIPAFKKHTDGKSYLFFPRIALDGPMAHNGYRRFLLGDQNELTCSEIEILLRAFWHSRQGQHCQKGDILLVNNIKYSHSRESFVGEREVSVAMAGMFWTDDVVQ